MKVAACQAPLLPAGSFDALDAIRARIDQCKAEGVSILCCPEAILGGLADADPNPARFAIGVDRLDSILAPLASDRVTTIIGFTELARDGRLYNTAAIFHQGSVAGCYRKLHPAIRQSVYSPGDQTPVFTIGGLRFGIVICNDSNFAKPAGLMAAQGATVLFIPTNNGLPEAKTSVEIVARTRNVDIARAVENGIWVVRADVAGRIEDVVSYGTSGIVDPAGRIVQSARELIGDLIVANLSAPVEV